MKEWQITLIDNTNGEIFVEYIDNYGFPTHLTDPFYGPVSCRNGFIIKVEKSMFPTQDNIYGR